MIHIGAHHAQSHATYEKMGAERIIWCEADPRNVDWIKQNLKDIELMEGLFWSEARSRKVFYLYDETQQSSANTPSSSQETKNIELITKTIDSEFMKLNLSKPIMLVLDVQGSEVEVLKGGKKFLEQTDFLVVELTEENDRYLHMPNPEVVTQMLDLQGFQPSISRRSFDASYRDQLFIKKNYIQRAAIRFGDKVLGLLATVYHIVKKKHFVRNYLYCKRCH